MPATIFDSGDIEGHNCAIFIISHFQKILAYQGVTKNRHMNSGDCPAASDNEGRFQFVKKSASTAGAGMMETMGSSICPLEKNVHSTAESERERIIPP